MEFLVSIIIYLNLSVFLNKSDLQDNFSLKTKLSHASSTTTTRVAPVEPAQAQWDCGRSAVVSVEHSWQRLLGELAADGQSTHGSLLVFGELHLRDFKERGASLCKVCVYFWGGGLSY